tara:strand:+ start:757 stop:1065 length:309 start_codon:yes stop_codon:yes gene_type:complete
MAISRYANLRTIVDKETQVLRYETFPKITKEDLLSTSDFFIEWNDSMRMDSIASEYLGDGKYWWIICLANDLTFPYGQVKNGDIIRIPSSIENVFQTIKNNR